MTPQELEIVIDEQLLSRPTWHHGGVSFPVPPGWRDRMKLGLKGEIDRLDDDSIQVRIYAQKVAVARSLQVRWGPGRQQRCRMTVETEPNSGRLYVTATFRPGKFQVLPLKIVVVPAK